MSNWRVKLAVVLLTACGQVDSVSENGSTAAAATAIEAKAPDPVDTDSQSRSENVSQPSLPHPRHSFAGTLHVLWESIPSDTDSVLLAPNDLQFSRHGLLVFDVGDRSVRVLESRAGRYLRSLSREGAGPGELSPRSWFQGAYDRPAVFDANQRRLVPLSDIDAERTSEPLPGDLRWISTCALDAAVTFGIASRVRGPEFFLASGGRVLDSMFGPWLELKDEDYLVRQSIVRQADDNTCVALTSYQPYFALYSRASGFRMGTYVERGPPVTLNVSVQEGGRRRDLSLPPGTVGGPWDARIWRDHLVVLFGGRTRFARRVLDLYRLDDLAYDGSLVLPLKGRRIAIRGDTIAVLGERDDYPVILTALLRPRLTRD